MHKCKCSRRCKAIVKGSSDYASGHHNKLLSFEEWSRRHKKGAKTRAARGWQVWNKGRGKIVACPTCGKKRYCQDYRLRKGHVPHCSRTCLQKDRKYLERLHEANMRRRKRVTRTCPVCKKKFETHTCHMTKHCSKACYHANVGLNKQRGEASSNSFKEKAKDKVWYADRIKRLSEQTKLSITPQRRKKHAKLLKKLWRSGSAYHRKQMQVRATPEYKANLAASQRIAQKQRWAEMTPKQRDTAVRLFVKASYAKLHSLRRSPNKEEKKLNAILREHFPGEFKLNVNGAVTFEGKIPDFINVNGHKCVVEMYGNYWHTPKQIPVRRKLFKKFGYSLAVIWASELNNERLVKWRIRKLLQTCHKREHTKEKSHA